MRTFLILILVLSLQSLSAQITNHVEVRRLFMKNEFDRCASRVLFQKLEGPGLDRYPIILAYRGVSQATMAECTRGKLAKYNLFRAGRHELERALEMQPQSWEIRYLRFQMQAEIPAFLNYRNFKEDGPLLMEMIDRELLEKEDPWFMRKVLDFLSKSNRFTVTERSHFKELQSQL